MKTLMQDRGERVEPSEPKALDIARGYARTHRHGLLESPDLPHQRAVPIAFSARGEILLNHEVGPLGRLSREVRVWLGNASDGFLAIDGLLDDRLESVDAARFAALHGERPGDLVKLAIDIVRWNSPGHQPHAFLVTDWISVPGPYGDEEPRVVRHINRTHPTLVAAFVEREFGRRPREFELIQIDADGILVDCDMGLTQIEFGERCLDPQNADNAILRLAWAINPNLLPPLITSGLRPVVRSLRHESSPEWNAIGGSPP